MTAPTGWSVIADAELAALRAENERLREALEETRQHIKDGDDNGAYLIADTALHLEAVAKLTAMLCVVIRAALLNEKRPPPG